MLSKAFQKRDSVFLHVCLISAMAFLVPWQTPTYAQVVGATLSGTVTDQSGGVVPQATISVRNIDTDITRNSTTGAGGFYSVPNLLPGAYEVRASAQGFSNEVQNGITLTVGEQKVLDFTLRVGQSSQTVVVTSEAPNVELASSSISETVNSTTVRELPLNGRSWTDLADLQPGVAVVQTQQAYSNGTNRGNRGFGNQIAVAGARPQENNYRLDGVSINDYANGAPGSVLGGDLGADAIDEFSVLTSNYSAEYGRTSGGVVNAITRSGTNQFHGGIYEFLRNDALDAANFFDNANGLKKASFRQNQFGVSAGGPIRKDKWFVFGDYEGIRHSKGIPTPITVPSNAARLGIVVDSTGKLEDQHGCVYQGYPDPVTGGCPQTGALIQPLNSQSQCAPEKQGATNHLLGAGQAGFCVDDSAAKYLPFWPVSARTNPDGNTASYAFTAPQIVTENFYTARTDYKLSEKDSLNATYLGDITPYSSPDGLDVVLINSRSNRQIGTLEESHTFSPGLLNTVRVGYSRDAVLNSARASAINPLAKNSALAALSGQFAAQVNVQGIDPFLGGVANSNTSYAWNSFQFYDDAFWTHGSHSLKFGGAVERMDANQHRGGDPNGVFSFSTLTNFLTNQSSRFNASFVDTLTGRGLRQTLLGFYTQDDWRVRSNLTLNLGLRWEMVTVPTEAQGRLSYLLQLTDAAPHLGSPLYSNPTYRNFDPRVGFAWDPFHNGKTAVRGGFGVFDLLPLPYLYNISTSSPFTKDGTASKPIGLFYAGAAGVLTSTSNTDTAAFIDQHPHRIYVMEWNLNIQRDLAPNLTALVAYVGSRGVHEPFTVNDADIVLPTKTPQGLNLFPAPIGNGTTLNTSYGDIGATFFEGNSSYHALELGVQKRMSHGLQFQSSFTWSKSIDNTSSTGHGDDFLNSISSLAWYDLKLTRGLSDFNIGRILVINGTWLVPSPKNLRGAAAWIANGWELGAIFKASDGVPFTATFGTDGDPQGLNSSDPWAFPNRLTGPGCGTLVNPGNPKNYIKTQCFAIPTAPSSNFYTTNCDNTVGDPTLLQCFNLMGNAGRNILIGPGTTNLDVSVFKNNYVKRISENFNVQFRAEFFNVLNHANFAVPVTPDHTDIFDSMGNQLGTAGVLTSTSTTSREIQFALKVSW